MLASMHCFQNALGYFATAVSYNHKMVIKLSPLESFYCGETIFKVKAFLLWLAL